MVNFNNETTVSSPAANIVKLLVIEARYNSFLALEEYNSKISSSVNYNQGRLRARLSTWFLEHQAYLDRTFTKVEDIKEITDVKRDLFFNKKDLEYSRILEIIIFLNNIMDRLRITKLDTKTQYDTTNIEEDNKANEYS